MRFLENSEDKLYTAAQSLMNDKKYSSACDVYKEIIKYYPNDYRGYYGYICALSENLTKQDITRAVINDINLVKEKLDKVCSDELRQQYDIQIDTYLNASYDRIQEKLEKLDAEASRMHSEQIAYEQLSKKKYLEAVTRKTARKYITVGLIVIFSITALTSLVFCIVSFVAAIRLNGGFYFKVFTDLAIRISFLLMCIFIVMTVAAIYSFNRVKKEISDLERDYLRDIKQTADNFSREYDLYQTEYQQLIKE